MSDSHPSRPLTSASQINNLHDRLIQDSIDRKIQEKKLVPLFSSECKTVEMSKEEFERRYGKANHIQPKNTQTSGYKRTCCSCGTSVDIKDFNFSNRKCFSCMKNDRIKKEETLKQEAIELDNLRWKVATKIFFEKFPDKEQIDQITLNLIYSAVKETDVRKYKIL